MVYLDKLKVVIFALAIFTGCQLESTLYLDGNSSTIDAKVYIDSVYVGKMKKNEDAGQLMTNIEQGKHQLVVKGKDGQKFRKKFFIKGENYIAVQF